ncbi:hypothetical protein NQ317_001347 [Molorchus minor]|uniref:Uncharacterized protein n=1 Tax=Molorchus minor TaxID=1323400 RepID=A0ABQ9JQX7_9CUCU|nr:hypothetical protein NQ317_001347 [Molorchus minor]
MSTIYLLFQFVVKNLGKKRFIFLATTTITPENVPPLKIHPNTRMSPTDTFLETTENVGDSQPNNYPNP